MSSRQRHTWIASICLLFFGVSEGALAGGGYYLTNGQYVQTNVQQTNVAQQDDQIIVLQEDIKEKKEEIIVLQKDIKEIDRDLRSDDPFEHGCDCRASLKVCDASVFTALGLDPESSTSCEDIYEKQPKLNRLPRDCRRLVRTCKRVDRREARRQNKERIRELEREIRECQDGIAERKKENRRKPARASEPCAVCDAYAYQPRMSNGAAIALGLAPYVTTLGLGLMNMKMYNNGIDAYYNAYNNSANQFYSQSGDYYNAMLQMGIPPSQLGYPAPNPMMGSAGGFGFNMGMSPMMGMNGMNPFGMNGMNGYSPFGINAGIGINAGVGLGMNPYGLGMQAAAWPYSMGMNAAMNPMMGLNGSMYMNPYGNMGWSNGGWNTGYNPYGNYQYQMMLQQQQAMQYQQYQQQQMYSAQMANQQLMEAQYRYQQVMNNAYSVGGYGGMNLGGYGAMPQVGLGINIGIGGSLGLGTGGYPSYGYPSMGGYNLSGGSTF